MFVDLSFLDFLTVCFMWSEAISCMFWLCCMKLEIRDAGLKPRHLTRNLATRMLNIFQSPQLQTHLPKPQVFCQCSNSAAGMGLPNR